MMNNKNWRGGYVRIGSVRVRVSQDEGGVGDECCCGVSWSSRIPVSKNNSASSLGVPSRTSHTSLIPALDRLPKFHFGSGSDRLRAPVPPISASTTNRHQPLTNKKKSRSTDKSDSLRELTEKLKSPPSSSSTHSDKASESPPKSNPQLQSTKSNDDDLFDVKLNLAKPESRAIVGAYIQRTIPFRSASFSQVDFSPSEGKYNIRNARNIALANKANKTSGSLSLPRKKLSEGCASVSGSSTSTLPLSSNLSLDSEPIEEWSPPKNLLPADKTIDNRVNSNRSLTHPLGRRGSNPDESIPYSSIDGNGLKSLTSGGGERVLEGVKEESDTDSLATTESLVPSQSTSIEQSLVPETETTTLSDQSDRQSVTAESCDNLHVEEKPINANNARLSRQSSIQSSEESSAEILKDIIEEEPNAESAETEQITNQDCKKPKDCNRSLKALNIPPLADIRGSSKESDDLDDNKLSDNNNVSDDKSWSSSERRPAEWASSAQEEPQSPEEVNVRPIWPRNSETKWSDRPRLVCQSSEEKEEDFPPRTVQRKFPFIVRADSLSEGESDNGGRTNTSSRGSPSLFQPSDQSDGEGKFNSTRSPHPPRRYSKRPLRGPYGQMLEAEMKKPETRKFTINHDDLKFLEEYNNQSSSQTRIPIGSRPRAMDDSQLKRSYTSPEQAEPSAPKGTFKRKSNSSVSSYPHTTKTENQPVVHHQRTTSSPSQLEGCSMKKEKRPEPSHQLLAQLLKGSSERNLTESNPIHALVNSPSYWKVTHFILIRNKKSEFLKNYRKI
ncbi:hypothetical protein O3M35_013232 [Rhynocoris fuscipes]|uniref:Uncharacterized protein n=1 Tax=Rhynocoris fuscipes TaxID=488301 RepID=A0AAW1CE31_9HEMI